MATISITVPDAILTRVVNGVAGQHNYPATVGGSPNPETRTQFARRMLARWVRETVKAYEVTSAAESARVAAAAAADSQLDVT